jgi:hypothetical protein
MRNYFIENCSFKGHDGIECQKFGVLFYRATINNGYGCGIFLIEIENVEDDIIVKIHRTFYSPEFIIDDLGLKKGDIIGTDMFNRGDENLCEIKITKKYYFLHMRENLQLHYYDTSNPIKYMKELLDCIEYAFEYVLKTYKPC